MDESSVSGHSEVDKRWKNLDFTKVNIAKLGGQAKSDKGRLESIGISLGNYMPGNYSTKEEHQFPLTAANER